MMTILTKNVLYIEHCLKDYVRILLPFVPNHFKYFAHTILQTAIEYRTVSMSTQ